MRHRTQIMFLLCLIATPSLLAQQDSCLRRTVLVSVTDEKGETLAGLTPKNFRGSFRGKPVQVASAQELTIEPRVVVLFDASGSMRQPLKWKLATALAASIDKSFPEQGSVALVVFTHQIVAEIGIGHRQPFLATLSALHDDEAFKKREARTAARTAILRGLELLKPSRPGDVIFLISDGEDNSSKESPDKVEQVLLASGVRLFATFLFGTSDRMVNDTNMAFSELGLLARASGGNSFSIPPESRAAGPVRYDKDVERQANASLFQLYAQMRRPKQIEVELPEMPDKPHGWKLELVPTAAVPAKQANLFYPRKLLPCAVASPATPK